MILLDQLSDADLLAHYTGEAAPETASEENSADEAACPTSEEKRQEAFRLLVLRHGRIVMAACRDVLRSEADAEDCFQATFFVLARKANTIERGASLAAWLHRAAMRISIRASKKRNRNKAQSLDAAVDQPSQELQLVSTQASLLAVHEAISKLPESLRGTVLLTYFEGLTRAQVAGRLGVTSGVIQSRLRKARGLLRRSLALRGTTLAALAVLGYHASTQIANASLTQLSANCAATVLNVQSGMVAANSAIVPQTLAQGVIRSMTINSTLRHAFVIAVGISCAWLAFGSQSPSGSTSAATRGGFTLAKAEPDALPPAGVAFTSGSHSNGVNGQSPQQRTSVEDLEFAQQVVQQRVSIAVKDAVAAVMEAIGRKHPASQLRKMGIAVHRFREAHNILPPGDSARDKNNRPLLSWRVHLLPYLGDEAHDLYKQFHLDEPWDSEHNKTLLEKMPPIFALADELPAGMSNAIAPYGPGTVMGDKTSKDFTSILDGSSNTILFFEAAPEFAVPWTKPDDFQFDPDAKDAMKRFGDPESDEFYVSMTDAYVMTLPKSVKPKYIEWMIGCADGQAISDEELRAKK